MYYIGTKQDCEDYNEKVNKGEGYNSTTRTWSKVIKHHNKEIYAIRKHENYNDDLPIVDNIDDFYPPQNDII